MFETGWIEITVDYEISVHGAPERDEYHEFKYLTGQEIRVPKRGAPDPEYIAARQRL